MYPRCPVEERFARFSYSAAFVLVIPKTRSKSRMND